MAHASGWRILNGKCLAWFSGRGKTISDMCNELSWNELGRKRVSPKDRMLSQCNTVPALIGK